jgi:hypothetical protein
MISSEIKEENMSETPNVKMDTRTMSNEEIETLFFDAYEKTVAFENNIAEYEVICDRSTDDVAMLVNIVGFAGSPTVEQYSDGEVEEVEIERADKGKLTFRFNPEKTTPLGGIDYQVVYES